MTMVRRSRHECRGKTSRNAAKYLPVQAVTARHCSELRKLSLTAPEPPLTTTA